MTFQEKGDELIIKFKSKYETNSVAATYRALKCTEVILDELKEFSTQPQIDEALKFWSGVRNYLGGIRYVA